MMLRSLHPEVNEFEQNEGVKPLPFSRAAALLELLNRWSAILQEQPGQWVKEEAVQMSVTKTALAGCSRTSPIIAVSSPPGRDFRAGDN